MKRLLISGFVSITLLAVATTWRSISKDDHVALTTGMASLKNSQATAGANKLPIEEYEDLSLVLSTPAKH
jgi:hypothetical protein